MGCTKSRVAPMPAKKRAKGKHSPCRNIEDSESNEKTWRKMVRLRTVKVTPAKSHLGGGDNPEYEDKLAVSVNFRPKSRLESFLYTSNKLLHQTEPTGTSDAPKPGNKHPATLTKAQLSQIQSDILRDLRDTGILDGQASPSGAVSFTVADPAGSGASARLHPSRRPPARLARLDNKTTPVHGPHEADKLKKKLEAAEKRRKVKQDAMQERLRAHSRLGTEHGEVAAHAERALQQRVADEIIEKELAFNERVEKLREGRRERTRAASRKGGRAKEVVDILDKECKKSAAETVAKKQKIALTNVRRKERLQANRMRLNQRHRDNVRHAVARRLTDQEEQAEMEMNYEIETARDSVDDGDFEPELQWVM